MRALTEWLRRLAEVTPEVGPLIDHFRIAVSGAAPLDIADWLLSVDPQGPLPQAFQGTGPESLSILRLPDKPDRPAGLHDRHRLGADLAALLSLALDRRIVIPAEIAAQLGQQVIFLPVAQVVDQTIQGPLPQDARTLVARYVSAAAGLPQDDQDYIGAACTAYHGALLLFDREPRAAYMLLVAGIEVLSRKYGSPPTDWSAWELSAEWDSLFGAHGLSHEQANAIRERLLNDKQLRLGLTFRTYASTRPRATFWDTSLDQWVLGHDAQTGTWLPPVKMSSKKVSDFVGNDRAVFRKLLAASYQLRSSIVHESKWLELMELGQPIPPHEPQKGALSFSIMRKLLTELIQVELFDRTDPVSLPDFKLLREAPGAA